MFIYLRRRRLLWSSAFVCLLVYFLFVNKFLHGTTILHQSSPHFLSTAKIISIKFLDILVIVTEDINQSSIFFHNSYQSCPIDFKLITNVFFLINSACVYMLFDRVRISIFDLNNISSFYQSYYQFYMLVSCISQISLIKNALYSRIFYLYFLRVSITHFLSANRKSTSTLAAGFFVLLVPFNLAYI